MINIIERKIKSFQYAVKHKMLIHHLLYYLSRAGIKITMFFWIEESIGNSPEVELNDNLENYSFEFLRPDNIKEISWLKTKQSVEERVNRLEGGDKCLGVKYKGEIIGYTWAELCKCSDVFYKTELKDNEAYLRDMHIIRSFRGKNIAPYLRIKCYKALMKMGYDTCYSISDYFNTPSIKFKKKLNAKFLTLSLYVNMFKKFGWTWKLKEYKVK